MDTTNSTAWGGIAWSIGTSLLGGVVGFLLKEIIAYVKGRKGPLTGVWEQTISEGTITKRDYVKCRQIGDNLKGKIERKEPIDQVSKKWKFQAQIRGSMLFGIFWATDLKRNPGSYGTLQLHMMNQSKLEGFYVKTTTTLEGSKIIVQLKKIPFSWQRAALDP
jgi:hypothetical protein